MKLLKWLSVADRFAKAYLDERLVPLGINSSQHMYLLKVCEHPGISQDALLNSVYVHSSNVVRMVASLEKKGGVIGQGVGCMGNAATNVSYPLSTICLAISLLLGIGSASRFSIYLGKRSRNGLPDL